jgi:hypothetical protein
LRTAGLEWVGLPKGGGRQGGLASGRAPLRNCIAALLCIDEDPAKSQSFCHDKSKTTTLFFEIVYEIC